MVKFTNWNVHLFFLAHCLLSHDFSMAGRLFNDLMYRLERKKRETPLPVEARSALGSSVQPAGLVNAG